MSRKAYDAVLFDFDGVLLDSEPVHCDCWREVLAPFGIRLEWDFYARHCIGIADRAMLDLLARLADPPVDPGVLWRQYGAKNMRFRERMAAGPPFDPCLEGLLNSLRSYKLAVVTSSSRAEVEPLLCLAGLRGYFAAAVYGETVERHKPAPDPYLLAADLLGARSALVVEDSEAGEISGRAAGFDVLRVRSATEVPARVRKHLGLD